MQKRDVVMESEMLLNSINRLLVDIYDRKTHIYSLLEDYLSETQMTLIKTDKQDEFLHLMLFGKTELADEMGRNIGGIRARLGKLGLIDN